VIVRPMWWGIWWLAFAGSAAAADRWYQVELLIFARTGTKALDAEVWPVDAGYPSLRGSVPILEGGGGSYRALPASSLRLTGAKRRLERAPGYRPLLHLAWRQPGLGRARAATVHLTGGRHIPASGLPRTPDGGTVPPLPEGAQASAELDGTVKVWVSRYLHLSADLIRRRLREAEGGGRWVQELRLTQNRRMRSKELHYLDHPGFGVLALITPEGGG
jgi:hypothetical protein